ncbi:methylmalonyl-CoA mutase family protein [Nocardioides sp. STR2]|uniref:Methylmalonyl-CoA mutase family protein n=1 Tax=Nocardioides pini TaxID=2975053 RepID=A0ABT4CA94_9ACTN|nr:methylmalonyl-CoA mutase family protein [Nocardioides pini]MCY4725291.1 methylmalonyl-CoA mutase family protein [Nocardioides pini]
MTDLPGGHPDGLDGGLDEPEELQPAEGSLRLVGDGDSYDVAAWEAATAAVLRKARRLGEDAPDSDVWAALTRTTLDGIDVAPVGQPSDLDGLTTGGRPSRRGAWDVRTSLVGDDAAAINEAALVDLDNGAASLYLDPSDLAADDLATALRGVLLDLAPVTLERPTAEQSEALARLLEDTPGDPHPGNNLSADPATALAFGEGIPEGGRSVAESFVDTVRRAQALGVLGAVVDGTALHDRGASDAQELGWTMAVGVHYLRLLTDAGLTVDEAAGLLEFRYAATDEQFPTIAKLRAARRLWARVLEASGSERGSDGVAQRQHVVTSRAMMTKYDPWVNMLRGTVAAFAAGVAGADALTVVPFDERLGRPDAFGRRIARNTSSLLIEESHVATVTDPAGGSYAVERLTDDLAVAGWAELGRIEADGGFGERAAAGVKERVSAVRATRDEGIADRSRPLTGVSEFPHLAEVLPERELWGRAGVHYGWAYEDMRAQPATTPVFLATMGPIAAHTARATFATNLLAAGGVAVESAGATSDVASVTAAYAGQPVVCLAGTDAAYAEWGADLVAALRAAGASYVVLAGKPGERTVTDVDDSCAMGVDALGFLRRIREELAR